MGNRFAMALTVGAVLAGLIAAPLKAGVRPLPKATVQVSVANPATAARDLGALINGARKSAGLPALPLNAKLSKAAQRHVDDMIRRGYFAHQAPDGSTPLKRTQKAGYKGCLVAENLSYSWKSLDIGVTEWMRSPGHRANMLNPAFREMGVGVGPNNLLVAVFATPC